MAHAGRLFMPLQSTHWSSQYCRPIGMRIKRINCYSNTERISYLSSAKKSSRHHDLRRLILNHLPLAFALVLHLGPDCLATFTPLEYFFFLPLAMGKLQEKLGLPAYILELRNHQASKRSSAALFRDTVIHRNIFALPGYWSCSQHAYA